MLFIFHYGFFITLGSMGNVVVSTYVNDKAFLSPLPRSFSYFSYFSASSVSSEGGWSHILAWDAPEGKTGSPVIYSCWMILQKLICLMLVCTCILCIPRPLRCLSDPN